MKNEKLKKRWKDLTARWCAEDYPGAEPVFQLPLLAKDVGIFLLLPLGAVIIFHLCQKAGSKPKKPSGALQRRADSTRFDTSKSQIIQFQSHGTGSGAAFPKKAPGALIRVKLQNVVATYSTAPVHAQIVDGGLGKLFMGGTLIGDATPDSTFQRINMTFRFARDPIRENVAAGIAARALALDGSLGLEAEKKEGFFTRSVYGSASQSTQGLDKGGAADFRDILLRALSAGFIQEFGSGAQVEKNRSQVLVLQPGTEFFAELTDFFPTGGAK